MDIIPLIERSMNEYIAQTGHFPTKVLLGKREMRLLRSARCEDGLDFFKRHQYDPGGAVLDMSVVLTDTSSYLRCGE